MPEIINVIAVVIGLAAGIIQLYSVFRKWYLDRKQLNPIDISSKKILLNYIERLNSKKIAYLDKDKLHQKGSPEYEVLRELDSIPEPYRAQAINGSAFSLAFLIYLAILHFLFLFGLLFWMYRNVNLNELNQTLIIYISVAVFLTILVFEFSYSAISVFRFRLFLRQSGVVFERLLVLKSSENALSIKSMSSLLWKSELSIYSNISRWAGILCVALMIFYFLFTPTHEDQTIAKKLGYTIGTFLPYIVALVFIEAVLEAVFFLVRTRRKRKKNNIEGR